MDRVQIMKMRYISFTLGAFTRFPMWCNGNEG